MTLELKQSNHYMLQLKENIKLYSLQILQKSYIIEDCQCNKYYVCVIFLYL